MLLIKMSSSLLWQFNIGHCDSRQYFRHGVASPILFIKSLHITGSVHIGSIIVGATGLSQTQSL